MSRTGMLALAILVAVLVGMVTPLLADVIITKTGDKYEGYVVRETDTEIILSVPSQGVAEMPIKKSDIIQHTKQGDKTSDAKKDDSSKATSGSDASASKGKTTAKKPATKKMAPRKNTAKKSTSKKKSSKKSTTSEPSEETTDDGSGDKGSSKRSTDKGKDKESGEE